MNILCTSHRIVNRQNPKKGIRQIKNAGFQNIFVDLSSYVPDWELELYGMPKKTSEHATQDKYSRDVWFSEYPENLKGFLELLFEQYSEAGLSPVIMQTPYLSLNTKRDDLQKLLYELALLSIESCRNTGCRGIIIKPLCTGIPNEALWEVNKAYYLSLAEAAKTQNMVILLENQCRSVNGHVVRGICAEIEEAIEWVDALNEEAGGEQFGFCIDVGACNICGQNIYDFVRQLGSRVKAVIVRDCDGLRNASLLPFTCVDKGEPQTDWKGLLWGLREIVFAGSLILDFSDTVAGFSPLLRPHLLQLAKSLGGYMAWQVEMEKTIQKYQQVVLFGAGNMCRNYMKYYSSKKMPLFTCDNNSKLWGTTFCGLEVSSPERLRDLPENCAILICNVFYEEIAEQLHNMKINNPIAYFSDEYLPFLANVDICEIEN